jgi:hypothetical protein
MKGVLRWTLAAIVVAHGLLHLLGAVKSSGWAEVTILNEPIIGPIGAAWLAAAALLVATGVLLAIQARMWWFVGAVALVVSQGVILTSSSALKGNIPNAILCVALIYTYRSRSPGVTVPGT